jgi:tetratricopeptide (TPR) repeat protein
VLDGDSARLVYDSASIRRAGGPAAVAAMRARAEARGLELARAWARADQGARAPLTLLVQGFLVAGQRDSALATVDRALTRPEFQNTTGRLWAGLYRFMADDPRGGPGLLDATRSAPVAELRKLPISDRFSFLATTLGAAGASGSGAEVSRVVDLWARVDTMMPQGGGASGPNFRWMGTALHVAQRGEMTAEERATLLRGLRQAENGPPNSQMRFGAIPIAYVGYLATRDTVFSNFVRRLAVGQQAWPELDASEALERGDTARVRTIAATFTKADSVAKARLGMAGMRTVLRAEIIAALGDAREAAGQYEALHPSRFNGSLVDPGHTVYVRSFAARARLYEQLGEREKAIGAWEEFLRRWEKGDADTEPARREARTALQRLRDEPSTNRP